MSGFWSWLFFDHPALTILTIMGCLSLNIISTRLGFRAALLVIVLGLAGSAWGVWQDHLLAKEGVQATACIQEVLDTGIWLNNEPVEEFRLRITPPSGQAYPLRIRHVLSPSQANRLQTGYCFSVRVHPVHSDLIDW